MTHATSDNHRGAAAGGMLDHDRGSLRVLGTAEYGDQRPLSGGGSDGVAAA